MKKLFIAILFAVIGSSAYANDLPAKTEAAAKAEVAIPAARTIEIAADANTSKSLLRRYKSYVFSDACGQKWIVYVSGTDNASDQLMWHTAYNGFMSMVVVQIDGCL